MYGTAQKLLCVYLPLPRFAAASAETKRSHFGLSSSRGCPFVSGQIAAVAARLCHIVGGEPEQIQSLLGHIGSND
jgi:hypothetical protein